MKKAILLLLVAFCAISFLASAQKNVNVDNKRFSFKHREVPLKPLEPRSFYYAVQLSLPETVRKYVDQDMLLDVINIEGQRRTDEPKDNDVIVNVSMEPVVITNATIRDRYVETKDKKTGRVSRTYYYWAEITYDFAAYLSVTQNGESVLKLNLATRARPKIYKSDEYGSSRQASEYWNNNKEILKEKFTREEATSVVKTVTRKLSDEYGYPIQTEAALIKTIKEKKHPENDPLRAMSDAIEANVSALDGNTPLQEADMAEIIEYFKAIPQRYTDDKLKADIRLRYVAYYNLCRIYLYLEQPDNVAEWANLLIENGHDKKDGERLMKDAEKLKEKLTQSGMNSRYFDPESFFED